MEDDDRMYHSLFENLLKSALSVPMGADRAEDMRDSRIALFLLSPLFISFITYEACFGLSVDEV